MFSDLFCEETVLLGSEVLFLIEIFHDLYGANIPPTTIFG